MNGMIRRRASSRAASSLRRSALPGAELAVPGEAGAVNGALGRLVTGADGGAVVVETEAAVFGGRRFSFFAFDGATLFAEGEVFRACVVAFDPNTDSLLGAALRAEVDDPLVAPADRRLADEVVREVFVFEAIASYQGLCRIEIRSRAIHGVNAR